MVYAPVVKMMIGFEEADKGEFFWKGEAIKPKKILRKCGVVLQNPAQYFLYRTVIDELVLGQRDVTPEFVREVLLNLGLSEISLAAHPKSLSGGQQRRLAVAAQLMKRPLPTLLILDEPLAGADWTARADIIRFIGSLKSKFSILLVSHEPRDILQYADRVVELKDRDIFDIDQTVISRAIQTRKKLKAEARERAIKEAQLYMNQMSQSNRQGHA